uniref:Uncharacterized protein n=1 Tax=Emiliania huxleyi (strain CCMP1516) TaxID=280463 RepID=A0A0D3L0H1_EMIH1
MSNAFLCRPFDGSCARFAHGSVRLAARRCRLARGSTSSVAPAAAALGQHGRAGCATRRGTVGPATSRRRHHTRCPRLRRPCASCIADILSYV